MTPRTDEHSPSLTELGEPTGKAPDIVVADAEEESSSATTARYQKTVGISGVSGTSSSSTTPIIGDRNTQNQEGRHTPVAATATTLVEPPTEPCTAPPVGRKVIISADDRAKVVELQAFLDQCAEARRTGKPIDSFNGQPARFVGERLAAWNQRAGQAVAPLAAIDLVVIATLGVFGVLDLTTVSVGAVLIVGVTAAALLTTTD